MKLSREFEIGWFGLALGVHHFSYELDYEKLLQLGFEIDDTYQSLKAKVNLKFDKKGSFFQLKFDIDGSITLPCDRCGQDFEKQLWDEFDLIVKLTGDGSQSDGLDEDDGDIVFISRGETVINVAKWIYEFLMLSIPIQHIHPLDENGQSTCDPKILELLNSYAEQIEEQEEEIQEENKKNIWKDLNKFRFDS